MATFRRILCRPYVSFALIANQALNIFCLNVFNKKSPTTEKFSTNFYCYRWPYSFNVCSRQTILLAVFLKGFTQALFQPDLSISTNVLYNFLSRTSHVLNKMVLRNDMFHHFCSATRASVFEHPFAYSTWNNLIPAFFTHFNNHFSFFSIYFFGF